MHRQRFNHGRAPFMAHRKFLGQNTGNPSERSIQRATSATHPQPSRSASSVSGIADRIDSSLARQTASAPSPEEMPSQPLPAAPQPAVNQDLGPRATELLAQVRKDAQEIASLQAQNDILTAKIKHANLVKRLAKISASNNFSGIQSTNQTTVLMVYGFGSNLTAEVKSKGQVYNVKLGDATPFGTVQAITNSGVLVKQGSRRVMIGLETPQTQSAQDGTPSARSQNAADDTQTGPIHAAAGIPRMPQRQLIQPFPSY